MDENREWSLTELESNEPKRIIDALLSLSFYDEDLEFVENICIEYSSHVNDYIRGVAVLCFGHLARIHGNLNVEKVIPIIKKAENDERL